MQAQTTEYREVELQKLEKFEESLPVLMKMLGESPEQNFKNRFKEMRVETMLLLLQ